MRTYLKNASKWERFINNQDAIFFLPSKCAMPLYANGSIAPLSSIIAIAEV
jgi:hypothetical protein